MPFFTSPKRKRVILDVDRSLTCVSGLYFQLVDAIQLTIFCLAPCLLLLGGCSKKPQGVTVFISGDTAGWITPCGCASNQSGGLARRSSLIRAEQGQRETLVLDAGGSASGTTDYQRLKLESILRGTMLMGMRAHNIGAAEAELGPEELSKLAERTGIRWLSANLVNTAGNWQPEAVRQLNIAGIKVAVVGVIDPDRVEHPQWQTSEPVQAVLSALQPVDADLRIVLAYMDEAALRKLATALPEVDYVVGGPTGQAMTPTRVGNVQILSATNKGKFLARLDIDRDASGTGFGRQSSIIEVASVHPENDEQLANLADYYARLARKDFSAQESGLVSSLVTGRAGYAIAGSAACAKCHRDDDMIWHASKHSHAWDVLVGKSAHYDPTCQVCHATGYGYEGGFVSVAESVNRVHVGCENCHGPSESHVRDPRIKTPLAAKEQCLGCHDHENSPEFNRDIYWSRILHGKTTGDSSSSKNGATL